MLIVLLFKLLDKVNVESISKFIEVLLDIDKRFIYIL